MIKQAIQEDFSTFMKLWIEYLEDQVEQGGDLLPTPKTISFFTLLFTAYVNKVRRGVVLLDGDRAVMLWGEGLADSPLDTKYEPQARSWGVYVRLEHRGQGISRMLYELAAKELREMGFKTMTTSVLIANVAGRRSLDREGFAFEQMSGVLQLNAMEEE